MGGKDNLIPIQSRSTEEQREIQSKGGRASGKSRRQRKSIREGFNAILSAPVKDKDVLKELKDAGADKDAQGLLLLRIYQQAINGDMQAAKLLLTAIGEADPAALELADARIDLAYLKLEALLPRTEPESGSNFLEALNTDIDFYFPNAAEMIAPKTHDDPQDYDDQDEEPTPDGE